ncbi:MAG TPA: tryptophan synthase subunit alpha [Bacillus bacterium]|nr:tryptophan synthase subunit alpha [Bacillus sp. (in: firmicutes)]
MNKIEKALKRDGKKVFVPYIMAGDGGLASLKEKLLFLQASGADAIEIGIPFSDPVADGPTIQRAGLRALKNGTTLKKVLMDLQGYKSEINVPLIIMSYLNPLVAFGIENFADEAHKAGVTGCIIPDLPIEEENFVLPAFKKADISIIRLVTLTTPLERIKEIVGSATGFIYAVTVTGITGTRNDFSQDLAGFLATVKNLSTIPVLAGFGVSSPQQIEAVCRHADGVIVGSKIIDLFEQGDLKAIEELIKTTDTVTTSP